MKRCSTSLAISKCQWNHNELTIIHPVDWQNIKVRSYNSCSGCEAMAAPHHADGKLGCHGHGGKQLSICSTVKLNPVIPCLTVYTPGETQACGH